MAGIERKARDLEREVAELRAVVDQLKGRLDGMQARPGDDGNGPRSRRDVLKLAGAAVAGAAGGVLLSTVPAAATDGGNVVLGNTSGATTNDAAHTTSLTATAATGPTPLVEVIGPNASNPGASGPTLGAPLQSFGDIPSGAAAGTQAEGIDGWAPGQTGAGVLGASDQGYGVVGETSQGIDLAAFGTGRLFLLSIVDNANPPNPTAGPPTFTPAQPPTLPGGELVRDINSVLWASRATGAGIAAWKRMNTLRVDAADGSNNFFQPVRVIDTRSAIGGIQGPLIAGNTYMFGPFPGGTIVGGTHNGQSNGLPADAVGIVGNVTVTGFTGNGFLAVFPTGASYDPNTSPSTMNYMTAWAWANAFTVGFGVGANAGKISIHIGFTNTHVIVDILAYLQ